MLLILSRVRSVQDETTGGADNMLLILSRVRSVRRGAGVNIQDEAWDSM